jgi:hypothetical protein
LQGEELLEIEGKELPVMIELPDLEGREAIQYNFEGTDFLGNRLRLDKKKVELGAGAPAASSGAPAKSWVSDF